MAAEATAGPGALPWRILLTVGPLVLAVVMVQAFVPASGLRETLPPSAATGALSAAKAYPSGLIGYAAAVCVHLLICGATILFFIATIRNQAPEAAARIIGFTLAYVAAVLLAVLLVGALGATVYKVGYGNVEALYPAGAAHLESALGGLSRVALAALLPTAVGMFAVGFGAAAAEAWIARLPAPPVALDAKRIQDCERGLKTCFRALSLVLVTSTFTASLFYHLPVRLYQDEAQKRVLDYANTVSIFWGAIFTLTLLAAFAFQYFVLRRRMRDYTRLRRADRPDEAEPDPFADSELFGGFNRQFAMLLTLLAPLLTGPLGNAIQSLAT